MQNDIEVAELPVHRLALTLPAAAAASSIGRTKLYAFIKEGKLKARKNGRHTVILAADLQAFLESLPTMEAA